MPGVCRLKITTWFHFFSKSFSKKSMYINFNILTWYFTSIKLFTCWWYVGTRISFYFFPSWKLGRYTDAIVSRIFSRLFLSGIFQKELDSSISFACNTNVRVATATHSMWRQYRKSVICKVQVRLPRN